MTTTTGMDILLLFVAIVVIAVLQTIAEQAGWLPLSDRCPKCGARI